VGKGGWGREGKGWVGIVTLVTILVFKYLLNSKKYVVLEKISSRVPRFK
jgi:hypothetical protein